MKRAFAASLLSVVLVLLAVVGCGSGGDPNRAETQRQFGVRMARMNLWREAMFRFRRAVEIDPSNAMAHNNLAVALEANGDFDAAAKEYREALRLDRSNQYIQKNYSRFVEFTNRDKKRPPARAGAGAAPGTVGSAPVAVTATSGTGSSAPPPPTTGTVSPPPPAPPPGTSTAPPPPPPPPGGSR